MSLGLFCVHAHVRSCAGDQHCEPSNTQAWTTMPTSHVRCAFSNFARGTSLMCALDVFACMRVCVRALEVGIANQATPKLGPQCLQAMYAVICQILPKELHGRVPWPILLACACACVRWKSALRTKQHPSLDNNAYKVCTL